MAEMLAEKGHTASVIVVEQLLKRHDFRPRKAFKSEAGKDVENRENLVEHARKNGNPAMSMDVKKRANPLSGS